MTNKTYNVLFLSTQNSTRSIMAEGLLNSAGGGRFRAFSAGSQPAGEVNPYAIEQVNLLGNAPAGLRSKSTDEFSVEGAPDMDFVITVYDEAAGEACPRWPGQPATANWSFRDPAALRGSAAEIRQEFATICREIRRRVEIFRNLPGEALDELAIQRKIARIAGVGR
ncbi:arsenate reductase ArsC [Pseudoduganella violaceinigra]|uniref:arsenate reductase ArsC n=1 Tax=Pseudoduganella violaceinigra TaxID=246602 RepID=UPI0003F9A6CF|nr:arsenate reductase ArsC [Pseudoduganella violaceinigra]